MSRLVKKNLQGGGVPSNSYLKSVPYGKIIASWSSNGLERPGNYSFNPKWKEIDINDKKYKNFRTGGPWSTGMDLANWEVHNTGWSKAPYKLNENYKLYEDLFGNVYAVGWALRQTAPTPINEDNTVTDPQTALSPINEAAASETTPVEDSQPVSSPEPQLAAVLEPPLVKKPNLVKRLAPTLTSSLSAQQTYAPGTLITSTKKKSSGGAYSGYTYGVDDLGRYYITYYEPLKTNIYAMGNCKLGDGQYGLSDWGKYSGMAGLPQVYDNGTLETTFIVNPDKFDIGNIPDNPVKFSYNQDWYTSSSVHSRPLTGKNRDKDGYIIYFPDRKDLRTEFVNTIKNIDFDISLGGHGHIKSLKEIRLDRLERKKMRLERRQYRKTIKGNKQEAIKEAQRKGKTGSSKNFQTGGKLIKRTTIYNELVN